MNGNLREETGYLENFILVFRVFIPFGQHEEGKTLGNC
jgi:hypothetical protein